ncbi:MAG: substrate-binding domain-containing protein, partial [Candidatus Hadarchaeum sp.]|uniref:substrate-binding domain-containing protein n=1 Tax=Candidatus Hadarchaeum sp. TaxID=2883567 RepID=UPI003D13EEC1
MKIKELTIISIAILLAFSIYAGSYRGSDRLTVSTTTSLYDTGLLDFIADRYLEVYQVKLDFIPMGTGQALEQARSGDVDAVLTHAPNLESQFLKENIVGVRKIIAYNFFIVVGPADDPAGIRGLNSVEAFRKIAELKAAWVSRGDNSGTNLKEMSLWKKAGIEPTGQSWYLESGSGMGETLRIASERGAYTLTDTGTYFRYQKSGMINLAVLIDGGEDLLNVYSVM